MKQLFLILITIQFLIIIGVVLLAGVFGAVIFVMGRTGQKLSNIFVIGLVLAIIFIAFGLMKKFI
jgi:hypothetical protein